MIKTFLIGSTHIELDGVRDLLVELGAEDFLPEIFSAALSHGPVALCSIYAKLCYRSFVEGNNANVTKTRGVEQNIKGCFDQRHGAIFEHCWLNFVTTGCSRVFTHELVRHRVGTAFSQTSGRYCTPESAQLVLPPSCPSALGDSMREHLETSKELIAAARAEYDVDNLPMTEKKQWTSMLRRIMPSGADNEMGWSVNVRALRHLIELRTSPHAEWEIRRVFTDVARIIMDKWPLMLYGGYCEIVDDDLEVWTGLHV